MIQKLRQSEARLRQAAKAGNVGLWDWDLRANRVYYSPEWKSQIGYQDDEISDDFSEWQSRVHPEDLGPSLQAVQEFIANKRPVYSIEFRFRHRSGSYRWMLAQGSLLYDEQGQPERMLGSHVDITTQKEAEEASKNEIQGIHECLVDGLGIADAETRAIIRVNRAMCQMFGYSEQEFLTKRADDLHPPDAEASVMNHFRSLAEQKEKLVHNIPCMRADGSVFFADIGAQPIELRGRKCLVGSFRDVTERLHKEELLRERETKYRALIETTDTGFHILDSEGRILDANQEYVRQTGHTSLAEILGRQVTEWTATHDLARNAEEVRKCMENGFARNLVVDYVNKANQFTTVEINATVVRGEAGTRILALNRDVTDRKQAEDLFRLVVEATPNAMAIVNGEGRITLANPQTEALFGYTRSELLGQSIEMLIPERFRSQHVRERHEYSANASMRPMGMRPELRGRHKDGSDIPLEISLSPIRAAKGLLVLASIIDLSQRKQAEEEREQLQAQLQQAQKMEAVGRLSGGVAHDFNNLLTVIQGSVGIATMSLQKDMTERNHTRVAAALEEIQHASERAASLTGQLLTFSRKHVTHVHVLDMDAVLHDTDQLLRRVIREDIAFKITCDPGEHLIEADKTQIEQVLVNLAVNATDAMPDGGRLTMQVSETTLDEAYVRKHFDARSGPHVLITVTDTGIGMDQNTLDHLFEPFFTTKPYGKGTGLGLSIVYGIIRQSGGHITVKSKPGKGSTFKLYLPAVQGEVSKSVETPAPEWQRGEETILLCEDEVSLRRLAASILTESGYTVIEAENGEQAVLLAADYAGAFQLLITDVIMPGMKGDKVATTILKDQPDVRVLFMSGYASDVLSVESITESGLEFLQKPFKPELLLQRVREILSKTKK